MLGNAPRQDDKRGCLPHDFGNLPIACDEHLNRLRAIVFRMVCLCCSAESVSGWRKCEFGVVLRGLEAAVLEEVE